MAFSKWIKTSYKKDKSDVSRITLEEPKFAMKKLWYKINRLHIICLIIVAGTKRFEYSQEEKSELTERKMRYARKYKNL